MLNTCRYVNKCITNQKHHQPHRSLHYSTIKNVNKCKQREKKRGGKEGETDTAKMS